MGVGDGPPGSIEPCNNSPAQSHLVIRGLEIWQRGSINGHCFPTAIFPDPCEAPRSKCHHPTGWIWPVGPRVKHPWCRGAFQHSKSQHQAVETLVLSDVDDPQGLARLC